MTNTNKKTFANLFSDAYQALEDIVKVTKDGVVHTLTPGAKKFPPSFEIGADYMVSTAKNRRYGTRHKVEGEWVSNPGTHLPSSAFSPMPPIISSLFTGPMAFISKDNPMMIIGLLALIYASTGKKKDKHLYSTVYNNIDTVIIDNEEIDKELYSS